MGKELSDYFELMRTSAGVRDRMRKYRIESELQAAKHLIGKVSQVPPTSTDEDEDIRYRRLFI